MAWIIATLGVLAFLAQRKAYKMALNDLNSLNEYTQFLLFHPQVYADHRLKFRTYLESIKDVDTASNAIFSYKVIEGMAKQGESKIILANTIMRGKPEDM